MTSSLSSSAVKFTVSFEPSVTGLGGSGGEIAEQATTAKRQRLLSGHWIQIVIHNDQRESSRTTCRDLTGRATLITPYKIAVVIDMAQLAAFCGYRCGDGKLADPRIRTSG